MGQNIDKEEQSSIRVPSSRNYNHVLLLSSADASPVVSPSSSPQPQCESTNPETVSTPRSSLPSDRGDGRNVFCFICGRDLALHDFNEHMEKCVAHELKLRAALPTEILVLARPLGKVTATLPGPRDCSVEFMAYNAEARQVHKDNLFTCPSCSRNFATKEICEHVSGCNGKPMSPRSTPETRGSSIVVGRSVYCYLCGGRTTSEEAEYHHSSCTVKSKQLRKKIGLELPLPPFTAIPEPTGAIRDFAKYNAEARAIYLRELPRCRKCLSTLRLDEYHDHVRSCRGPRPQAAGTVSI